MPEIYARAAIKLAVYAGVSVVIGLSFGVPWGWGAFCAALLLTLVRDVAHLERLRRWADGSLSGRVPEGRGNWMGVFDALYRRQRSEARGRMRLARALARSRQAGRALPYGVTLLDRDHRIAWCNDAAERDLGIMLERDRGQTITHLVREPDFDAYLEAHDGRPLELKSRRPGGRVSVQLIPYAEHQWLLLTHDITQAARVETMRRDFVANVSHELRTPLTVLVGFLETMRELEIDSERSRNYLSLMQEQGARMQRIIDDLLTLSTLESAPEPGYDERVNMAALLGRIHRDAEALSAGRHAIRLEIEPEQPDLLGSGDELGSAFANLVSNAVRYTPSGGEIRMSWRMRGHGAEFAVEDTGAGIAPEHIPRLTERFYRVDRGRSRETGGTGLGLAIVKHALARHQAELHIESEVGRGSRFAARFPARRVAPRRVADVTR